MLSSSCCTRPEPRRRGWRPALLAALLCGLLGGLPASGLCGAATWRDELPQAVRLGGGEMRWLGLRIYEATLWAAQRPFQPEQPFALQLRYHRNISRQRLVQTSLDEIARVRRRPLDGATLARWEAALNGAFTDVAPGDQLIGVYAPGAGMRLYNEQRLLAAIDDVALARAFFAIWLDQDTRDQGLRRQLLGDAP